MRLLSPPPFFFTAFSLNLLVDLFDRKRTLFCGYSVILPVSFPLTRTRGHTSLCEPTTNLILMAPSALEGLFG